MPRSEVPITKLLKGAGTAAGAGFAIAEVLKGNSPKDALTLIKSAAKGAGLVGGDAVTAAGHVKTILEAAAQHLPTVGKVLTQSIVSTIASGAGESIQVSGIR